MSEGQGFPSARDFFAINEAIGGLRNGYSILRDTVETNRKEGLEAQRRLTDRMDSGFGSLRAEMLDELHKQELRMAGNITAMEARIIDKVSTVSDAVSTAMAAANKASDEVTVAAAVASTTEHVRKDMITTAEPIIKWALRVIVFATAALLAGREITPILSGG